MTWRRIGDTPLSEPMLTYWTHQFRLFHLFFRVPSCHFAVYYEYNPDKRPDTTCNWDYFTCSGKKRNAFITVASQWARWRLKSPASPLFSQPSIQALIKEDIKLRVTSLWAGNSPVTGEFSGQVASNTENVLHSWVIMFSSSSSSRMIKRTKTLDSRGIIYISLLLMAFR